MNYRNSGADARKPSRRSKLRLLLTRSEAEKLDQAVRESGAWSRGLLIAEALRAGLTNPNLRPGDPRRRRRVDANVPRALALRFKEFAAERGLPQQHLLRHFLLQYLAVAPWEDAERQSGEAAECD